MKKSQRLRLAALQGKVASHLTTAEKAELAELLALASKNPDSSKDVDDTKAARFTLSDFFSALTAKKQLAEDLAAAHATIATVTTQRDEAVAAKGLAEAAQATAVAGKAEIEGKLAAANATLAKFAAAIGLKAEEFSSKSAEELQAAFNKKSDALATDRLASLGFPESGLPAQAAASEAPADDRTMTHAEFSKLSPTAKKKFSLRGGRLTEIKYTGLLAGIIAGQN